MEERNKFLTEAMGYCWHEWTVKFKSPTGDDTFSGHECKHCGTYCCVKPSKKSQQITQLSSSPNFSTWDGFGKLWTWAKKQEWWENFVSADMESRGHVNWLFPIGWINPGRFANAVHEYLSPPNAQGINKDRRRYEEI